MPLVWNLCKYIQPPRSGRYLVTHVQDDGSRKVYIATFSRKSNPHLNRWHDDRRMIKNVIAWKEVDQPYQGDK